VPVVIEDWGYWRIVIDGVNVTVFRGGPDEPRASARFSLAEPFCGPATVRVPKLTPLDSPGGADSPWWNAGAPVQIIRLHQDGTTQTVMWTGMVADDYAATMTETAGSVEIRCIADIEAAALQMHQPPAALEPTDIGHVVADVLNSTIGRRFHTIARVTTGILTTKRGSDDQTKMAYAQELLADATTDSGTGQWTVKRTGAWTYAIVLKDRATQHYTLELGQRGLSASMSRDYSRTPTHIYGSGVDANGFGWTNMHYPGYQSDSAPSYPFSDPGDVISIGTTDGDTTSGSGVSDLQRRINELNITGNVAVDGVYNSNDAAAIREIQRHYGLTVDGVVGGQTWTATWDVGGGAQIGGMVRLPLAWISEAQPFLWNADGSTKGDNPGWDPSTLTVDLDINYGSGVAKSEAKRSARAQLARDYPPGITANMTLRVDPEEGHRFGIAAGENIRLYGAYGAPLMHIAGVEVDTDGPVSLVADDKARDLLTLAQLRERKRELAVNPVRLPRGGSNRRSTQARDAVVPFDGESRGGIIPRHALYSGLWSVIDIPVAQSGRIAKTHVTTTSPASPFALALFGAPITPAQLNSIVGDPLAGDDPWEPNEDELDEFGWIEGWGSSASKCGVTRAGVTTGRFRDSATLEFRSLRPPRVWVALRASTACFVSGRLYPAPLEA
jgi:hypothetical protein